MEQETKKKLGYAKASAPTLINLPDQLKPGYVNDVETSYKFDYKKVIKDCRKFYHDDPIAGTVLNRLADIAITDLRNRRKSKNSNNAVSDEVLAYYNHVAQQLKPFLKQLALEFVLHGMIIPEYTTIRKMGNRATDKLGRTRYYFPKDLWIRNVDNIELVKLPTGAGRVVYLRIPQDEIKLIKAKPSEIKEDAQKALRQYLEDNFPEYVAAIKTGKTRFELKDVFPVYRKLTSYNTYPLPYLTNALDSLKHKMRLKAMDMSITARIIEAVRQISVGNDEFPAEDDDLKAEQQSFSTYANSGEKIFNYFTNHTVKISWSYPPFESLLNDAKYSEPNREILMALGFPRVWLNGETEKSNSSDNSLASAGPLSTMNDMRDAVLTWVRWFYEQLAELNGFDRIPEVTFSALNFTEINALIQYACDFYDKGAVSKETLASLYGEDWESVQAQREAEEEIAPEPVEVPVEVPVAVPNVPEITEQLPE